MSDLSDRIAGLTPEKRALLLKRLKKNLVTDDINISRRDDITSYPMSFAQQRMWFLNQWETDSPFYNVTSILQIKGDLDVERLQRCLDEVIQRHEILRAYFRIENGKPVQQIYPTLNLDYPFYDLSQLDQEQRKRQLQIITSRDTQKGFNLNSGPLIRCTFVKVDVSLFVVILTMHHIVTDGWSTGIINREISILYDSFSRGLATPLPEIPLQYSDYAAWEKNWLRKDIIQDKIRYWKEILANPNVYLDLPSDFPRPKVQSFRGAHQKILVPDEIKRKLVDLSQNREVSFFMVLLSVYAILLFRYSGQEDIRIGSPVANRNRTELETNI